MPKRRAESMDQPKIMLLPAQVLVGREGWLMPKMSPSVRLPTNCSQASSSWLLSGGGGSLTSASLDTNTTSALSLSHGIAPFDLRTLPNEHRLLRVKNYEVDKDTRALSSSTSGTEPHHHHHQKQQQQVQQQEQQPQQEQLNQQNQHDHAGNLVAPVTNAPSQVSSQQHYMSWVQPLQVGRSHIALATHSSGISPAVPITRHNQDGPRSEQFHLDHPGASAIVSPPVSETFTRKSHRTPTQRLTMTSVGSSAMHDGRTDCQEGQRRKIEKGKETYGCSEVQATVSPHKRRAPHTYLSIMTVEEQSRWKRARSRKSSALSRQRQADREQELREQVEALSLFQVLVKAAPDAILLVSSDIRACILFANDRCDRIMRLAASEDTKEQELVGQCLWEWMDARDKVAVVEVMGMCKFYEDMTGQLRCTIRSPLSSSVLPTAENTQQQLRDHHSQHHQQDQHQHQQEAFRVDLTLRSSLRGMVMFLRPVDNHD